MSTQLLSYHNLCVPTLASSPRATLFPYTTLFRSVRRAAALGAERVALLDAEPVLLVDDDETEVGEVDALLEECVRADDDACADRKSTRLNSSHLVISYAVFCSKKTQKTTWHRPKK